MSNVSAKNKSDVKQLAQKIEQLARNFQTQLDSGSDVMLVANELARNNMTFVFALGEFYAQQQGSPKISKSSTWHNVRDSLGRFTRKS